MIMSLVSRQFRTSPHLTKQWGQHFSHWLLYHLTYLSAILFSLLHDITFTSL